MSRKENGNPAAAQMARERWEKTPPKKRSEHARKMLKAQWDAYYKAHPEKWKARLEREARKHRRSAK